LHLAEDHHGLQDLSVGGVCHQGERCVEDGLLLCLPALQRREAQARLLTEGSFAQVAEKCGSHPRVIETFHDTFFHVRDRLRVEGYILFQVIGPKAHRGLTEGDVDVILKMYAYSGGPIALDRLVDYFKNPPVVPERPEQLGPAELRSLRDRLLIRASIVLDALPINGKTLHRLDLLRDAADVFRRGSGLGDGPDNLKVPLTASPSNRDQFAEASIWRAIATPW
jgi:hypothetical protein